MEWNFTYENQEASSFLVYQLEKSEQLDTVGMGMLSNNQIPHILPLLYTQIDEERYLRYAIPGRIPLGDYLEGMVSLTRSKENISVLARLQQRLHRKMVSPLQKLLLYIQQEVW